MREACSTEEAAPERKSDIQKAMSDCKRHLKEFANLSSEDTPVLSAEQDGRDPR